MHNIVTYSSKGKRSYQQDRCYHNSIEVQGVRISCLAVADGMGGHRDGHLAAQAAVKAVENETTFLFNYIRKSGLDAFVKDSDTNARRFITEVFREANELIRAIETDDDDPERRPGTTLVCSLVLDQDIWIGNIGDSRAFLISQQGLKSLTRDDTALQQAIDEGTIKPEDAHEYPYKHVLTHCLDGQKKILPAITSARMEPDENALLFLSTDGFHGKLDFNDYRHLFQTSKNTMAFGKKGVRYAIDIKGSTDNATVIILEHTPGVYKELKRVHSMKVKKTGLHQSRQQVKPAVVSGLLTLILSFGALYILNPGFITELSGYFKKAPLNVLESVNGGSDQAGNLDYQTDIKEVTNESGEKSKAKSAEQLLQVSGTGKKQISFELDRIVHIQKSDKIKAFFSIQLDRNSLTDPALCWSMKEDADDEDTECTDTQKTGSSFHIDLESDRTYYVHARANRIGGVSTLHTSHIKLNTYRKKIIPDIQTNIDEATITAFTADAGGIINYDGGSIINESGVCYLKGEGEPGLSDTCIKSLKTDGNRTRSSTSFLITISDLEPGNDYTIRAYAKNETDTLFGNAIKISTLSYVQDIDGNEYPIVKIGDAYWFAKNLQVTRYRDGTEIHSPTTKEDWTRNREGATALHPHEEIDKFNNAEVMADTYGRLYNWYAVDNDRGLCPDGWKVPTVKDWSELERANSATHYIFSKKIVFLQDRNPISLLMHPEWLRPSWSGEADQEGLAESSKSVGFGFNAIPAGFCNHEKEFQNLNRSAHWWSSNEDNENRDLAIRWRVVFDEENRGELDKPVGKNNGFSVRCVKK